MRIALFAADADLRVDRPFVHKSQSYVDAEVKAGRLVMRGRGAAQVLWGEKYSNGRSASFGDWFTSHVSVLPDGTQLRITTKQLHTGGVRRSHSDTPELVEA